MQHEWVKQKKMFKNKIAPDALQVVYEYLNEDRILQNSSNYCVVDAPSTNWEDIDKHIHTVDYSPEQHVCFHFEMCLRFILNFIITTTFLKPLLIYISNCRCFMCIRSEMI